MPLPHVELDGIRVVDKMAAPTGTRYAMKILILLPVLLSAVHSVDVGNFKNCGQSSFCRRNRKQEEGESVYVAKLNTLEVTGSKAAVQLLNTENNVALKLELISIENNIARIRIDEVEPLKPRYVVQDVLMEEPKQTSLIKGKEDANSVEFNLGDSGKSKVLLTAKPFRMDFMENNELVLSVNSRGLLSFEHIREKSPRNNPPVEEKEEEEAENEEEVEDAGDEEDDEDDEERLLQEEIKKKEEEKAAAAAPAEDPDLWEEKFKTHHDSKPNGPESISLDFSFVNFDHVYGIPEHADTLALKTTTNTDPYRLYNLDVFEYDLHNPMALYGSVPYMLAHNAKRTMGLFWMNAAETWIDITSNTASKNMFNKLMDYAAGGGDSPQTDTRWISESGIIDTFVLLGPTPSDVFKQYASLTGTTALPPLFSIAYHQCRWNYNDETDVKTVDSKFDEYDIPYDVLWLDIEHTEGKKYMTWDKTKFPTPLDMLNNLASKSRKMVTIIDPHIKKEDGYHIYKEAKGLDYFVKNKDGNDYEGWCWPGTSAWLDFLNPAIRDWWASKLSLDQYEGSTLTLFTWNDMNEPSVFNGPEVTMHKDAKHFGGWEHRDIHNIYGMYQQMATGEGQIKRSGGKARPFVLSRAFFAGSQRYGAIWTGDNTAEWSHLKMSLPMLMSIGLAGITFIGADVGGFFRNPDSELLTRWYQAGAYQPFFRAHAHLDTKRREPWLLPEENMLVVREAIRQRYAYLPFWYTQFYKSSLDGKPIMRPLWVDFPDDTETFAMENQYLIGDALLVHPISDPGTYSAKVYFPGENQPWYDVMNCMIYTGKRYTGVSAPLSKIPVFQRGGTIVPRKERVRRSSSLMQDDPYTLVVAVGKDGNARGDLYMDDGHSFDYKEGKYLLVEFEYSQNKLVSRPVDYNHTFTTKSWLEKVIIMGVQSQVVNAEIQYDGSSVNLGVTTDPKTQSTVIRKPGVNMSKEWTINLR
ncbi:neutral alpha-glucosidase AB-like isoform X2 [Ptychodera flava]|uniref:neutral alpha-glucosidase AB-like isoform X2 n=1 Tax=Ptychodera flava TaxID=63121 RepID=UPI00396A0816